MVTIQELAAKVGTTVLVADQARPLTFECKVLDAKVLYGKIRLQVTPVEGYGKAWVDESSTRGPVSEIVLDKGNEGE